MLSDAVTNGDGDGLPTEVAVDFTGFEDAYGAGYVDRLQVVALPECVLEDPVPEDCDTLGERLPTRVDYEAGELVAEVGDLADLAVENVEAAEDAAADEEQDASSGAGGVQTWAGRPAGGSGGGSVVFGLTSGAGSETGNAAATPFSPTGQWQVTPGSGEFSWSHPLDVPEVPAGGGPELGLSYSSGAVDGLTNATNAQGSATGLGWSPLIGVGRGHLDGAGCLLSR